MKDDRSVIAALALTFFGPIGLFYVTPWWIALVWVFAGGLFILVTLGFGLVLVWPISMIWAALAASRQHSVFLRELAGVGHRPMT